MSCLFTRQAELCKMVGQDMPTVTYFAGQGSEIEHQARFDLSCQFSFLEPWESRDLGITSMPED